jgi:hypothetical protein
MKTHKTRQSSNQNDLCDVLMITHERPEYFALSLPALLESGDESLRVWIWQNGENKDIARILRDYSNHDRLYKVHRSPKNLGLREPTNWLWRESDACYVGKVDDDILIPKGWLGTLKSSHEKVPRFGALGCWVSPMCDFNKNLVYRKTSTYESQKILESPWVPGCAYLMKRICLQDGGLLSADGTFPGYCYRLAWLGWVHGWPLPLLSAENMDDPRSPYCILKTEEEFQSAKPLTAQRYNLKSLEEWKEFNRKSSSQILKGRKKAGRCFWMRSAFKRLAHSFRQGGRRIWA